MARLLGEFVHIVSAMGVFCALGIEAIALYQDRRAVDATQAEIASSGLRAAHRIAPLAGAATVVSGWYLTQTVWGWHAGWITISLACVMIVAAISATTAAGQAHVRAGRTRARVRMSPSFTLRAGLLVGILFLMTVKPPFAVSLIAVTIAAGAGWLIGLRPMTAVAGAADPAPHTKSLHSDSAYDRPAVTDLNAKTVSLWLVVVIAAGIIFIGARFLVVPWAAAAAFGVPADDRSSLAYLWAKGSRDMVSGLLLLALVWTRAGRRVVAFFIGVAALIPLADFFNVYVNAGTRNLPALEIHGGTAIAMLLLAKFLQSHANPSQAVSMGHDHLR